ncbi:ankyrin repeat-containing protein, partial [Toxoplasma gondii ARI]
LSRCQGVTSPSQTWMATP